MRFNFKSSAMLAALVVFAAGCDFSSIPKLGNYQGTLIENSQRYAVRAKLTHPSQRAIHLEVTGDPSTHSATAPATLATPVTLDATLESGSQNLRLSIPEAAVKNLSLVFDGTCFSLKAATSVKVCAKQNSIQIQVASASNEILYSLSLEHFDDVAADVSLEKPQTFTLDEAVTRTLTKDFGTLEEFQHMIQAHLGAKQAYLNLLPHLSNASIYGLTTGGPLNVVGALGMADDLLPFLFPSRWVAVHQAQKTSQAENDAYAIMRGDAGLQVQIMAYAIDHDLRLLENLKEDVNDLFNILSKVKKLEDKNQVPAGTSAHLESILFGLHDAMDDLSYPLEAQYAYLSQAMGFVNPKAVNSVEVPQTPATEINGEDEIKMGEFQDSVLNRSLELRQIGHLIDAANDGVRIDKLSWFDPAADGNHALGAALPVTIKIDKAQIEIIKTQKQQTASQVLTTLSTTVTQYNHSIDDTQDSTSGLKLEQDRLDKLNAALDAALNSGGQVSDVEITTVVSDKLTWQTNLLDGLLDNRTSLAHMDRLLLQGYYSNLDDAYTYPSAKKH